MIGHIGKAVALAVTAVTVVPGLALACAAPASATTVHLSGDLNTAGNLITYGTYRYHSAGSARFSCTNSPGTMNGAAWFRLGLRDRANTQITNSPQWDSSGQTRNFLRASNSSTTIPAGYYAINARMQAVQVWPPRFAGDLSW